MTALPRPRSVQAVLDRYDALRDAVDWVAAAPLSHPEAAGAAAPILLAEARLLDARAFDRWLGLYAADATLWLPVHLGDHPGRDQALIFDDRRRMAERAWRMSDPQAWAATAPEPTTLRALGPVEAWSAGPGLIATATLTLTHVRRGPALHLRGRQILGLAPRGGGWEIAFKTLLLPELALGSSQLGWLL